ncbi:MAG TPA: SLBB domain-containing protein [Gemmatimonadaceae bacterium]|nr:SLBB domain-containing protein [Gemmatimonadaceae bacterium]
MFRLNTRALIVAAMVLFPALAFGQNRPTSEEAARILRTNPALLEQLRQRILSSGLTPDQVRARLKAEGYPENLLDAYLGSGDSPPASAPLSDDIFAAVSALGITDSLDLDLLRCGIVEPGMNGDARDSVDASGRVAPARKDSVTQRGGREQDRRNNDLRAQCRARLDSLQRGLLRKKVDADSGFTIFGLETFRQSTNLFDANLTGPVDPSYQLGPGDQLVLILTGDVEQSYQLEVTREGFVVIPQVGQLFVNNLSLAQLEDLLYSRLGRVYSGVRRGSGATTRFYISPAKLSSNQIFVQGDVMRPGAHRISSAGTAMNALYAAGGPTDNGTLRRVQIRRAGRTVAELDVYDYLLAGDASNDVRLRNGDIVFVPLHGPRVRIVGEIARPATYEMREGEALDDAITFAGGFTPEAARARVQIERILPPAQRVGFGMDRVVTEVFSDRLAADAPPAVPVHAGDVIRVFPVSSRIRNRIAVRGNVWTPGKQGITPGRTTVAEALRGAGGVKPDTYLGQILVSRMQRDSSRIQLRASLYDTTGSVIGDFPLQEDDEITVFSVSEFRQPRYVAISGAVNKGGRFEYREGMTVRDLVLVAGGLEESALLTEAEVARLPVDRTGGRTATTFRVPLDSSYIFSRGPDGRYLGPPGLPAAAGPMPDQPLLPYDNVLILRQPNWELQRNVTVMGEVRYPGTYALRLKSERISEIIARAGGLTTEGYADGIVFVRLGSVRGERTGRQAPGTADLNRRITAPTGAVGRIGIELPRVLRNQRDRDNLILQDGDSIFIPRYSGVVHVTGAVNSPIAVAYVPGKDLPWYVRSAGGPAARADLGRSYVTQPNGKVEAAVKRRFVPDDQPKPRAGGVIFVPERDPGEVDSLSIFSSTVGTIASVLGSLVAIFALINR